MKSLLCLLSITKYYKGDSLSPSEIEIMKSRFNKETEMSSKIRTNHDVRDREVKIQNSAVVRVRCEALFR